MGPDVAGSASDFAGSGFVEPVTQAGGKLLPERRWIVLFAGLLVLRALIMSQNVTGGVSGDGHAYLEVARHIANCGCLPPARGQPHGYAILLAPIVAIFGVAAPFAVQTFHLILDVATVALLWVVVDREIRATVPVGLRLTVALLLALQPFSASMITPLYTETPVAFLFFAGLCALSGIFGAGMRWRLTGCVALGTCIVLRMDMALPALAALGILVLLDARAERGADRTVGTWRLATRKHVLAGAACVVAMAIPVAAVVAWQQSSTQQFQLAENSPYRPGHMAWLRTWFATNGQHERLAFYYGDQSWPGFDLGNYPLRAFDSVSDRENLRSILGSWRRDGYTNQVDAAFMRLAEGRQTLHGLRPMANTLARTAHYWINIDGTQSYLRGGSIQPPVSTALVGGVLILRIVLIALAGYAALRLMLRTLQLGVSRPGWVLGWLCFVAIVVRTLELGVLGTFMWAGLMEVRYVTVVYPPWLYLSAFGVIFLWSRMRHGVRHQ